MPTNRASFANLTCTFGNEDLLDYAETIVLPAFTDETLHRNFGKDTSYFFHNVQVRTIPQEDAAVPLIIVYGHFVYNTVLKRTQTYSDATGLRPSPEQMPTAPSAFFVFILNNHKLGYLYETPHAPGLKPFATTINQFITKKHKAFLDAEYDKRKDTDHPATRAQLATIHPYPDVNVLPLANHSTVAEFVNRFDLLHRLEFQLFRPNQEIRAALMWQGLEERQAQIGSSKTIVSHVNPKGLEKNAAAEQISEAAATGNEHVRLSGKDHDGNTLKGDNEELKLEVTIPDLPEDDHARAERLATAYNGMVENGILIPDHPGRERTTLLQRLARRFQQN
jgi:hypothetical protein